MILRVSIKNDKKKMFKFIMSSNITNFSQERPGDQKSLVNAQLIKRYSTVSLWTAQKVHKEEGTIFILYKSLFVYTISFKISY